MTTKTDNEILKRLEEEGRKKGLSTRFLEFYQRLFRIQSRAEQRIGVAKPGLKREGINDRIEHGLPLIRFDELVLDWSLLKDIFAKVTATFAEYPEFFGEVPRSLKELSKPTLLKEMAKAWFEGARLPSTIAGGDINEALLKAIIHATLRPFLVRHSKALFGLWIAANNCAFFNFKIEDVGCCNKEMSIACFALCTSL